MELLKDFEEIEGGGGGGHPILLRIRQSPSLLTVRESCVKTHVLFPALLLNLAKYEDLIISSPVGAKTSLAFWKDSFCNGWHQFVEYNTCKNLAGD